MAGLDVIIKDGTTYQMMPASTAGQFSTTTAYAVGDFVYFDGVLYKCTTAHTGAFVASHFTAVTVGAELKQTGADLQSEINDVKSDLSQFQTLHIFCESGTYTRDVKTDNVARIRNVYPISIRNIESIIIPDGYEAWIFKLDVNRSFIGAYTLWVHGEVAIADVTDSQTYYLNMGLRLISDPSADISSDVETVSNGLIIKNAVDESITELRGDVAGMESDVIELRSEVENLDSGLSDEAKEALLACFRHVAWTDEHGQDYYDTLEASLYDDFPKIIATFNSGTNVIYTDDPIDTLKQYLTVKYYASKTSVGETIPSTDYTLFGQLVEGDNSVRADYGEYKTTFIVNAVDFYNIMEWSTPTSLKSMRVVPGLYNNTCGYSVQAVDIRASVWAYRGKKGAYYSNESAFDNTSYPIPIPSSATKMSIVCNNLSNVYAGVSLWKYNPTTETYTRNVNGAWTPITGTEFDVDRSTNDFVTIVFKISSSSGEVFPEDPNVTVTFE